jgi:aryl-alcohol dehydrogenase-like predicted oxidoreductase
VLYHEHVAGVIPGFRSVDQVTVSVNASGKPLNGEEIAFIRKSFC